jgi:hypothetical protein
MTAHWPELLLALSVAGIFAVIAIETWKANR